MSSVRSGRIIDSALQRKGFLRVSVGDHVHYYFLRRNGERSSIKTKMSHGMLGSTISVKLIGDMALRSIPAFVRRFLLRNLTIASLLRSCP
ncbi:MAG: hypothetical protein LBI05_09940 [Planctomycetaceae bacterium]|jgi:hypothetical protein|nr:hypothetical protein [Planctomycetaceae bacterium]